MHHLQFLPVQHTIVLYIGKRKLSVAPIHFERQYPTMKLRFAVVNICSTGFLNSAELFSAHQIVLYFDCFVQEYRESWTSHVPRSREKLLLDTVGPSVVAGAKNDMA